MTIIETATDAAAELADRAVDTATSLAAGAADLEADVLSGARSLFGSAAVAALPTLAGSAARFAWRRRFLSVGIIAAVIGVAAWWRKRQRTDGAGHADAGADGNVSALRNAV